MPQPIKDITGQQFGTLTALQRHGVTSKGELMWLCNCSCGSTTVVRGSHLRRGQVASCGGKGRGCTRTPRFTDLTGRIVGNLTVLHVRGSRQYKDTKRYRWDCRCMCGNTVNIAAAELLAGRIDHCGCLRAERRRIGATTHGKYYTPEYRLLRSARTRARDHNVPFALDIADIVIPTHCPLLGIELRPGRRTSSNTSPSLDRLIPQLGYVRGNVWVISQLANRRKSDMDIAMLRHFADTIESQLQLQAATPPSREANPPINLRTYRPRQHPCDVAIGCV